MILSFEVLHIYNYNKSERGDSKVNYYHIFIYKKCAARCGFQHINTVTNFENIISTKQVLTTLGRLCVCDCVCWGEGSSLSTQTVLVTLVHRDKLLFWEVLFLFYLKKTSIVYFFLLVTFLKLLKEPISLSLQELQLIEGVHSNQPSKITGMLTELGTQAYTTKQSSINKYGERCSIIEKSLVLLNSSR